MILLFCFVLVTVPLFVLYCSILYFFGTFGYCLILFSKLLVFMYKKKKVTSLLFCKFRVCVSLQSDVSLSLFKSFYCWLYFLFLSFFLPLIFYLFLFLPFMIFGVFLSKCRGWVDAYIWPKRILINGQRYPKPLRERERE